MSDSNPAVALALGAGGGLLLWYLLRDPTSAGAATTAPTAPVAGTSTAPGPSPSATGASSTPAPSGGPPRASGPCSLLLDANGLTTDGDPTDIPTAVNRCRTAGSAELVVAKNGPAAVYTDLATALKDARVPFTVKAP